MILGLGKRIWQNAASFIKPQVLRKSVMVSGEDDEGVVCQTPVIDPYNGLVKFRPYPLNYLLVGIEPARRQSGKLVYRFFDPASKKEFLLTKELVDLLFHKVVHEVEPGELVMVSST